MEAFPTIFGPYLLLRPLGAGGMGEVLLARQDLGGANRLVAVKRLHLQFISKQSFLRMFLDELSIVSKLSSPHIGHILDAGRVGNRYYMTMEYLPGKTLQELLKELKAGSRSIPLDIAVEIGCRIASALDHAHTRRDNSGRPLNIVHRDVSPDNVILTVHGDVKLVDFGIAKAKDRLESTRIGVVKGKISAMAPEQILGGLIDSRTDVFGLGVLLYRMLTGRRPFRASGVAKMLDEILEHRPPSVSELNPECPKELSNAIERMMAKNPDDRFWTMGQIVEVFEGVMAAKQWMVSSRRLADFLLDEFPEGIEVFDETTCGDGIDLVERFEIGSPDFSLSGIHRFSKGEPIATETSDTLPAWGTTGPGSPAKADESSEEDRIPSEQMTSSPTGAEARVQTTPIPAGQGNSSDEEAATILGLPDWAQIEDEVRYWKENLEPKQPSPKPAANDEKNRSLRAPSMGLMLLAFSSLILLLWLVYHLFS